MTTRNLILIALFAAVIAALGLIPKVHVGPVPITAQSLGVMLAGAILGSKRGALAVGLFLILVAFGLPLLAGGRGGYGVFVSASSGYLIGFVFGAYLTGFFIERAWDNLNTLYAMFACLIGGVLAVHIPGIIGMSIVLDKTLVEALKLDLIFIPGDVIKASIAAIAAVYMKRSYPIIGR